MVGHCRDQDIGGAYLVIPMSALEIFSATAHEICNFVVLSNSRFKVMHFKNTCIN